MHARFRAVPRFAGGIALVAALAACGGGGGSHVVPTADAGVAQVARVDTLVTLDGRASVDRDGRALTYQWTQVDGPPAALDDAASVQPTFTPVLVGTYAFELRAGAGGSESGPSRVNVVVVDDLSGAPRRAPAAEPRAVDLFHAVFLASPPGDLEASPPQNVRADASEAPASFVDLVADPTDDPAPGDVAGLLEIDVVVSGTPLARLWFPPPPGDDETVSVDFADGTSAPVLAYAVAGKGFVLDATRSQDDDVIATFDWTQVDGPFQFTTGEPRVGATIVLVGTYEFELTATDATDLASFARRVTVPVLPFGSVGVGPPLAEIAVQSGATETSVAGQRTIRSHSGHWILLDDSKSRSFATGAPDDGPGALLHSWHQVSGPPVRMEGADAALMSFRPDVPGEYAFEVTVTDANGVSGSARIEIGVGTATDLGPVAALAAVPDAILPAPGLPPLVVTLDGRASDGGPAPDFLWTQVRGPPVVVEAGASGPAVGLVPIDRAGTYEFELRVFDGTSRSTAARRTFTVFP